MDQGTETHDTKQFGNHRANSHGTHLGIDRWRVEFPNGYGASIITGGHAYGPWEVAVLADGQLTYDTPITDDVVGHLPDEDAVGELLDRIAALPAKVDS